MHGGLSISSDAQLVQSGPTIISRHALCEMPEYTGPFASPSLSGLNFLMATSSPDRSAGSLTAALYTRPYVPEARKPMMAYFSVTVCRDASLRLRYRRIGEVGRWGSIVVCARFRGIPSTRPRRFSTWVQRRSDRRVHLGAEDHGRCGLITCALLQLML